MARPWTRFASVVGLIVCMMHGSAWADQRSVVLNKKSIGILAGEEAWIGRVQAVAHALDHEDGLRILPISGNGSVQAINDLLQLQGVDAALISSDSVAYAEGQGLMANVTSKIAYLARFGSLPVVLVTRNDIGSITALAGRKISTGPVQSAAFATGELIFGTLGIPFTRVARSGTDAIAALEAGSADAALLLGTEALHAGLDAKRFHILTLPLPAGLDEVYAPAILESSSLGGLNAKDKGVETIAASLTLAVYDWPKNSEHSAKLKLFSNAFFALRDSEQQSLVEPGTNVASTVMGWQRHATATQALEVLKNEKPTTENLPTQEGDGP